ncbi:MAG: hypothetical protein LUD72_10890, partial [Bacteroidales bacterium]|nr:hypothetical protein [Bacteroidales bacterium]
ELRETIVRQETDTSVYDIMKYTGLIRASVNADNLFTESMREELNSCVDDIISTLGDVKTPDEELAYSSSITEQMIAYTMSVNGNTDREYIREFIENMRAGDAREYRTYVSKNRPGVDFSMKVNIPESDGGGSFTTFLRLDNTAFINL